MAMLNELCSENGRDGMREWNEKEKEGRKKGRKEPRESENLPSGDASPKCEQ